MTSVQKAVEDCMTTIFDDVSIHPSGVITAWKNGGRVQIVPYRPDGELWGWKVALTDRRGNIQVFANTADYAIRLVHKIQKWGWEQ